MNVDKHQASGITQYTKQAAVCWHSVQFHDMSYLISMLLVHEHATETSWINTWTITILSFSFTSPIIWTNATEWSTWILIFHQHKSVPVGSFGCVSLFPQSRPFLSFRTLSPFAGSYPIPIYPLFTPSWGTRRPRGNGRWLRTPADAGQSDTKWRKFNWATESNGNQIEYSPGGLESSPHGQHFLIFNTRTYDMLKHLNQR